MRRGRGTELATLVYQQTDSDMTNEDPAYSSTNADVQRQGKKTVVVGATPNPGRYAYLAANMLKEYKHEVVPLGIKEGDVAGAGILDIRKKPAIEGVDTITLYIGPQRQPEWYGYLLGLKPRRIIFNPGTENEEFEKLAEAAGVEVEEACTLVLLRSRQF